MQIYGILLRFRGIFTENAWKIMENMRKIIQFLSISFHNLFRMTRFSRSFSVVFGRFFGHFWRKSEKNGEYRRHLSVFFPFHSTSLHFHSSFPNNIITFAPEFIQLIAVMKKIILFLAIMFMAIGAKAQSTIQSEDGKYPVYCDLKAYNFWGVGKVKVMLDMGAVSNGGGSFESLYGEDGKQIKFNTVMAAVNYMAKKGWILDKTYYVTEGAGRAVLHYVLVKRVKNDDEIRAGLITKDEQ